MSRRFIAISMRCLSLATIAAATVTCGLGGYCAWEVRNFYADAEQLPGTIVAVNRLPGGYAPVVKFTDGAGTQHTTQLGPFYETLPTEVGQVRPIIFNPQHQPEIAIDSLRNWIGSTTYGVATAALIIVASVFFMLESQFATANLATRHGA